MRLNAWLEQRTDADGTVTNRDTVQQVARNKYHPRAAAARALLEQAEWDRRPEALDYLFDRFETLRAMREVDGMVGQKRMTPPFIRAARDLFDWQLTPREVLAIVALDGADLSPGDVGWGGDSDDEADDGLD